MAFYCKHYNSKDGMCTCSFLRNEFGNFPRCNAVSKEECIEKKAYLIAQDIGKCMDCPHLVSVDLTPETQDCFCRYYPCGFFSNSGTEKCSAFAQDKADPRLDPLVWWFEWWFFYLMNRKSSWGSFFVLFSLVPVVLVLYFGTNLMDGRFPLVIDAFIFLWAWVGPLIIAFLLNVYVCWRYPAYSKKKGFS